MDLRAGMRPIDVPRSDIRTYANEQGLEALAAFVKVLSERVILIDGKVFEALVAEEMGLQEPDSDRTIGQIESLLERLSDVLPLAVSVDYVNPTSVYLETDTTSQVKP